MGTGISLVDAMRVMAFITANEEQRLEFAGDPAGVMAKLGVDVAGALEGCGCTPIDQLASLEQLRKSHDALLGRLLSAHLSNSIHHLLIDQHGLPGKAAGLPAASAGVSARHH